MTPTCSNCGAHDFVWASKVSSGGLIGGGGLSLRARGEAPLGTRICRSCGHADLFLHDLDLLRAPHRWKAGEFVPMPPRLSHKPAELHPPSAHPGSAHSDSPAPSQPAGASHRPHEPPRTAPIPEAASPAKSPIPPLAHLPSAVESPGPFPLPPEPPTQPPVPPFPAEPIRPVDFGRDEPPIEAVPDRTPGTMSEPSSEDRPAPVEFATAPPSSLEPEIEEPSPSAPEAETPPRRPTAASKPRSAPRRAAARKKPPR